MLTLADPKIRRMPLVEKIEQFVSLDGYSDRIAVDRSRSLITSQSEYFLFVRLSVAERLVVASQTLPDDFRLLVIEGYRPLAEQQEYFRQHMTTLRDAHPEIEEEALIDLTSRWVAPPAVGAHPTGAAIDLTLQYRDGSHIDMGSVVNATDAESSGSCYTQSAFINRHAANHRKILTNAMTAAGFVNYPSEWWHWSYGDRYWAVLESQPNALYGPVDEETLRPGHEFP
jgi:zinc D-Ala-D-Ala dipeptidase